MFTIFFLSGVVKLSIHHSWLFLLWSCSSLSASDSKRIFSLKIELCAPISFIFEADYQLFVCLHQKKNLLNGSFMKIEHNQNSQNSVRFHKLMNTHREAGIERANYCYYKRKNCKVQPMIHWDTLDSRS